VMEQVLPEAALPFDPPGTEQLTVSLDVQEAITSVVFAPVGSEALTANVLTRASLLVSVVKAVGGLRLPAPWACAHGYVSSPKCSLAQPNWAAVRRR
jgi:hypothetical protein